MTLDTIFEAIELIMVTAISIGAIVYIFIKIKDIFR